MGKELSYSGAESSTEVSLSSTVWATDGSESLVSLTRIGLHSSPPVTMSKHQMPNIAVIQSSIHADAADIKQQAQSSQRKSIDVTSICELSHLAQQSASFAELPSMSFGFHSLSKIAEDSFASHDDHHHDDDDDDKSSVYMPITDINTMTSRSVAGSRDSQSLDVCEMLRTKEQIQHYGERSLDDIVADFWPSAKTTVETVSKNQASLNMSELTLDMDASYCGEKSMDKIVYDFCPPVKPFRRPSMEMATISEDSSPSSDTALSKGNF